MARHSGLLLSRELVRRSNVEDQWNAGIVVGDDPYGHLVRAPWADSFVALGARLARYAARLDESQLVVAITVPMRDLAAVLVACGWVVTRPLPGLGIPAEVASSLEHGTPVRMITDHFVIAGPFFGLLSGTSGPRIRVGGTWELGRVHALTAVPGLSENRYGKRQVGIVGSFMRKTGRSGSWAVHQCAPNVDLAILGTKSWLAEDMEACIGWGDGRADAIGDILLPDTDNSPTWATRIYAAQLLQELDMPTNLSLVVLDGASAIRWLPAVQSPVVLAIIDRRVADDSPAEIVMQVRSRSEIVPLDAIGWRPPPGVEAMAFEVKL
jgi:hypothetical protein